MREHIRSPRHAGEYVHANVYRLLRTSIVILATLTHATSAQQSSASTPTNAATTSTQKFPRLGQLVRLRIALAPAAFPMETRATVVRHPKDAGIPTVLLSASGTVIQDVRDGIAAGLQSLTEISVSKRKTIPVRNAASFTTTGETPAAATSLMESIRGGPAMDLPGVGQVHYRDIVLRRPRSAGKAAGR